MIGLHEIHIVLDKLNFESILLADGDPILSKGKETINNFFN